MIVLWRHLWQTFHSAYQMCCEWGVIDGKRGPWGQEGSVENGRPEDDEKDSGKAANHADTKSSVKTMIKQWQKIKILKMSIPFSDFSHNNVLIQ